MSAADNLNPNQFPAEDYYAAEDYSKTSPKAAPSDEAIRTGHEIEDNYGGESHGFIHASIPAPPGHPMAGKPAHLIPPSHQAAGMLEFGANDDGKSVRIKHVQTLPDLQHRGVGTAMLGRLQQEYPGRRIDPGLTTPAGDKLWNRFKAPRV